MRGEKWETGPLLSLIVNASPTACFFFCFCNYNHTRTTEAGRDPQRSSSSNSYLIVTSARDIHQKNYILLLPVKKWPFNLCFPNQIVLLAGESLFPAWERSVWGGGLRLGNTWTSAISHQVRAGQLQCSPLYTATLNAMWLRCLYFIFQLCPHQSSLKSPTKLML